MQREKERKQEERVTMRVSAPKTVVRRKNVEDHSRTASKQARCAQEAKQKPKKQSIIAFIIAFLDCF